MLLLIPIGNIIEKGLNYKLEYQKYYKYLVVFLISVNHFIYKLWQLVRIKIKRHFIIPENWQEYLLLIIWFEFLIKQTIYLILILFLAVFH